MDRGLRDSINNRMFQKLIFEISLFVYIICNYKNFREKVFLRIRKYVFLFLLYFPYQRDFSCAILDISLVMLTYGAASYSSGDFLLRVSAALTYGGLGLRIFLFLEKEK